MPNSELQHGKSLRNFRTVNVGIFVNHDLDPVTRMVGAWMMTCHAGWKFSHKGIQKMLGLSLYQIKKSIKQLKATGYLTVDRDDSQHRTIYVYTIHAVPEQKSSRCRFSRCSNSSARKSTPLNSKKKNNSWKDNEMQCRTSSFSRTIPPSSKKNPTPSAKALAKATSIAEDIYGDLNPRAHKKPSQAVPVILELHKKQGYAFGTIRKVLKWGSEQMPTDRWPGWRHFLQGSAPQWLIKERRGKDRTPFEAMHDQMQSQKNKKAPSGSCRVECPEDFLDDWEVTKAKNNWKGRPDK